MYETNQSLAARIGRRILGALGAVGLTLLFFLVLPLMQSMAQLPEADRFVRAVDTGAVPPPPPPPEPEPEQEPEPDEAPEELQEEALPPDLSQLEMALDPGFGSGFGSGELSIDLNRVLDRGPGAGDSLFDEGQLDQQPRVVHQTNPSIDAKLRRRLTQNVTVNVIVIIDERGRVGDARVQTSTDSAFDRTTLAAVRQWRFEPGRRQGQPVATRLRIPFTFPKAD
jgi:protein TonB